MVDATPIKGRASKLRAGRILSDGVMFFDFEDITQVVSMSVFDVFDTEVIDYNDKLDGMPFVTPNTRDGGCVLVASCIKTSFEKFACKDYRLGETIDSSVDFEVDSIILDEVEEIAGVSLWEKSRRLHSMMNSSGMSESLVLKYSEFRMIKGHF